MIRVCVAKRYSKSFGEEDNTHSSQYTDKICGRLVYDMSGHCIGRIVFVKKSIIKISDTTSISDIIVSKKIINNINGRLVMQIGQ